MTKRDLIALQREARVQAASAELCAALIDAGWTQPHVERALREVLRVLDIEALPKPEPLEEVDLARTF